ncbi:DUF2789 domain-containing protein [Thiothrix nivea]|uniref:DUF2789 domain-containing protein n=1 Tax=Thiothrix nivea (strain ATCC 35100 / DSM 5205 / JP2) TaxID=870187 RepID=A0A656HM63_THINJ|nr:DUF2789 domain-containing protein [Thiothrix nivea]EIJ36430.1 hypothetical protein Thini_3930 [Thiothrix nivea DSM 5205]
MMTEQIYNLSTLFEQLGMSGEDDAIDAFIEQHPLDKDVLLAEAEFWTPAQANFLREGLMYDSNWAEVIDELNVRLHA